jgi:hypothetical protein
LFQVAHKRRLRAEDQAKLVKEILISGSRRPSTQDLNADKSEKDISGSGSTIQNDENGKFLELFSIYFTKKTEKTSSLFFHIPCSAPKLPYAFISHVSCPYSFKIYFFLCILNFLFIKVHLIITFYIGPH